MLDRLCGRLMEAAIRAPRDSGPLELTLGGGQLQGVVCRLEFDGRRIGCRLRAAGAVVRRLLTGAETLLSARLGRSGFALARFEVTR